MLTFSIGLKILYTFSDYHHNYKFLLIIVMQRINSLLICKAYELYSIVCAYELLSGFIWNLVLSLF